MPPAPLARRLADHGQRRLRRPGRLRQTAAAGDHTRRRGRRLTAARRRSRRVIVRRGRLHREEQPSARGDLPATPLPQQPHPPRSDGLLRPGAVPVLHVRLRRGVRRGRRRRPPRPGPGAADARRLRRRPHHQPQAGRQPGHRRHGRRHRHGAAGTHRHRPPRRPDRQRQPRRLPGPRQRRRPRPARDLPRRPTTARPTPSASRASAKSSWSAWHPPSPTPSSTPPAGASATYPSPPRR